MYLIIKKVKYKNNIIFIFILVNNAKKEKKKTPRAEVVLCGVDAATHQRVK